MKDGVIQGLGRIVSLVGLVISCGGGDSSPPAQDPLPPGKRPILPGATGRGGVRGRLVQGTPPRFADPAASDEGNPWAGATVEATRLDGEVVGSVEAGADGSFALEKLPTGLIRLRAFLDGTEARADATVVPGVTVEVGRVFPIPREQAIAAASEGVPPIAVLAGTMNPLPAGVVLYPAGMPDGTAPIEETKKTLATESYLFVVDEAPTTMQGHPLRYVLVDAATGAAERIEGYTFLPVVNHGKPWRSLESLVHLPAEAVVEIGAPLSGVVPVVSPEFARVPTEIPPGPGEKLGEEGTLPPPLPGELATIPFEGSAAPGSKPLAHFNNTGSDGVYAVFLSVGSESAFEQDIHRMSRWLFLAGISAGNMARATIGNVPAPSFTVTGDAQTDRSNRKQAIAQAVQRATLFFEPQIQARLDQGKHSTLLVYLTGHGAAGGMNLDFLGDTTGSFVAEADDFGLEKTRACRLRVILQSCQSGGLQDRIAAHLGASGHDLQIFASASATRYATYTPGWVSYIPVLNLLRRGGSTYTKELVEELKFLQNGDIHGLTETLADGSVVQAKDLRELDSAPPPPFLRPAHPPWCFPGEGAGGSGVDPTGGAGGVSPTEPSVLLDYDLIPGELKAGDLVAVSRFTGGNVSGPDQGCAAPHFHAQGPDGVRVDGGKGPFADKAPSGCGFGKIFGP